MKMSDLVHCLECDHLWFEQDPDEDCPSCGGGSDFTAYVSMESDTYTNYVEEDE